MAQQHTGEYPLSVEGSSHSARLLSEARELNETLAQIAAQLEDGRNRVLGCPAPSPAQPVGGKNGPSEVPNGTLAEIGAEIARAHGYAAVLRGLALEFCRDA